MMSLVWMVLRDSHSQIEPGEQELGSYLPSHQCRYHCTSHAPDSGANHEQVSNCWRAGRIWVLVCYDHNHSIWLETSSHDPAPDTRCRFWETAEGGKMEARGNAPERVEKGNVRGSSRSSGGWSYGCRATPCGLNFSLIWKKKGDWRSLGKYGFWPGSTQGTTQWKQSPELWRLLFFRGGNNVTPALVDECAKPWYSK